LPLQYVKFETFTLNFIIGLGKEIMNFVKKHLLAKYSPKN